MNSAVRHISSSSGARTSAFCKKNGDGAERCDYPGCDVVACYEHTHLDYLKQTPDDSWYCEKHYEEGRRKELEWTKSDKRKQAAAKPSSN